MPRKRNPEWPSQSRERKAVYRNTRIAKLKGLFDSGQRRRAKSKRCSRCDQEKPSSEFHISNACGSGLGGWCKTCNRESVAAIGRKKLGVSPEQYAAMLDAQDGKCAICLKPDKKRSLSLDHNHETGAIRALLCTKCNTMLGAADESAEILTAAMVYLERHKK